MVWPILYKKKYFKKGRKKEKKRKGKTATTKLSFCSVIIRTFLS